MTASIPVSTASDVRYILRLGDACLILAQRLSEWCGHAPILEEDLALANLALDLLGQARALLSHAGQLHARWSGGEPLTEDQLAFLREERDYFNPTLLELPRGDFAFTVLRNAMAATWLRLLWERLGDSSDPVLAAIAGKAVKESTYHQEHAADWTLRLGRGTQESSRRMVTALQQLWPYTAELFEDDAIDEAAAASGLGPRASQLREPWLEQMRALLAQAHLEMPAESRFRSFGRQGRHSEHMGYLLAELQHLQRAYPGGVF